MKYLFFCITVTITLSSCVYNRNDISERNGEKKITIKYTDFDLLTSTSVSCDQFETYFQNEIAKKTIADSLFIASFMAELDGLKPITGEYSQDMDTRAKIDLMSGSQFQATVCIGDLTTKYDGKTLITSKKIKKIIQIAMR